MKRCLSKTIFILGILLTFGESANAEILRCEGRSAPSGQFPNSKVTFDIVMPVSFDSYLTILDREKKDFKGISSMAGHGTIEIKKVSLKSERFPFLITRKPSATNQLYGFFIEGEIPIVIHIDTWKKGFIVKFTVIFH